MIKSRAQDRKALRERTSNSRSFGAAVETSGPYIRNYIGNDINFVLDNFSFGYYNRNQAISKIDVLIIAISTINISNGRRQPWLLN